MRNECSPPKLPLPFTFKYSLSNILEHNFLMYKHGEYQRSQKTGSENVFISIVKQSVGLLVDEL